jgi:hypothetical protein
METSYSVGSKPSADERVVNTPIGSAMDLDDSALGILSTCGFRQRKLQDLTSLSAG